MAEYTIDKIEYGGNVYKLQDSISGYTSSSGTVTSITAGVGLTTADGNPITSSGTIKAKLNSETSLGTIGSTSKLYAVGVDSNGQLGVKVPWANDQVYTINSNGSNDLFLTGTSSSSTSTGYLYKDSSAWISVTADDVTDGQTNLFLGNNVASTSTGGKRGAIYLYGTGTVYTELTALATSTARYISLPNNSGTIALTSDIPTVPSNIVNTITTTAGAHTAITNATGSVSFNVPTTAAHVGAASSSHTHGNITNGGDITTTAPTIANGDQIIINDHSASKITNGPTFDGSTTTTALTPKGTWETFSKFSGSYNDLSNKPSNNVTGSGTVSHLAMWSGTNTLSGTTLPVSSSYDSSSDLYGTIKLYIGNTGQIDWKGQLAFYCGSSSKTITITPPSITADRIITLPDKTGTIALTSDLPTVPSNIVNTITTTAGTHTVITSQKGNVSFNVPTKTSHLTNDSGFITSYTDENVTSTKLTSDTKIYLTGSSSSSTVTGGLDKFAAISAWRSSYGYYIEIGDNNYRGHILCYRGSYFIDVSPTTLTSSHYFYWPDKGGTIAVTDDLPSITLNGSSTTSPSFYAPTGAGTSGQYLKSSGSGAPTWTNFPTIPSITLNGSSTTSPSFYAPTGAGTSGQYLKSNGSGAPSWTNFPTIPSITLNGSSTTSPSFYAPTSVGTSGNYLKSSGSGAPTWEAFPTIPSISLNGSSTTSPSFYAPTSAGTDGYYLTSNGSGAPSWTSFPTTISILQANVLDTNDTAVGSIAIDSNGAVEISNHSTSTKAVLDSGFSIVGSSGEIATIKSGGVFIQDHTNTTGAIGHFSSNNGTKDTTTPASPINDSKYTALTNSIKFTAGTWLLVGEASFPSNTNGSRSLEWRSGATSSSLSSIATSRVVVGPSSSGFATRVQSIATVQSDSDVYVALYGYMYTGTSGTSVTISWDWRAIRIA